MTNHFNRYFIVLTFVWSVFCLYLLFFTNWFDTHQIWILNKFHLYIIFFAWLISCLYTLRECFYLKDHIFSIETEDTPEEKEKIINQLSRFYELQLIEEGMDSKTYVDHQGQKIFIYYDDYEYFVSIKFSLLTESKNKKFLLKIRTKLIELIENEYDLQQLL